MSVKELSTSRCCKHLNALSMFSTLPNEKLLENFTNKKNIGELFQKIVSTIKMPPTLTLNFTIKYIREGSNVL